jgi:hypothetical protein
MTFSFADITLVISHPSFGQYSAVGEGLGNINIVLTNDVSANDIAADGKVVTSKIRSRGGSVALSMQQTSSFDRWLTKLYNYLQTAPSSEWALATITIRAPYMKETTICTGVSFQKLPDKSYQAQVQQKIWNMLAEDVQENA